MFCNMFICTMYHISLIRFDMICVLLYLYMYLRIGEEKIEHTFVQICN